MRSVFISNGSLAALYDSNFCLRDLYYPYLGKHNQSVAGKFKVGIWHDGKFTWLENVQDKNIQMQGLMGSLELQWDGLSVSIKDLVTLDYPAILRKVAIDGDGFVRVLFYNDFKLNDYEIGDTAFYDPADDAVYHYKDFTWFGIGSTSPIYEYTTGRRDLNAVLPDCEDGSLSKNPIAQGSVASAVSMASKDFYYFMVAGPDYETTRQRVAELRQHPDFHMSKTQTYWDVVESEKQLSDELARKSLVVLLGHVGDNGAIPASLDTSILKFNLDTYAYTWPRDASLVAATIDAIGYWAFTRKYFSFAFKLFNSDGYLFQKFNSDGTMGSTWHPWTVRSPTALNFQEDETATLIWAFWDYFVRSKDYDLLKDVYDVLVKAANFMTEFRDKDLKLPLESYDLWEEKLGVHTYTVASVIAGLRAASNFAKVLGDAPDAAKWEKAAEEVSWALRQYMFDPAGNAFYKTVHVKDGKVTDADPTVDSSALGIVTFGVMDPKDPMVESTVSKIVERLWVQPSGGLARYENDMYQRVNGNYGSSAGNPWIVTTAWLAEYHALRGENKEASSLLDWIRSVRTSSGLLPEQVSPFDKSPLSVTPLLWSHSEYLRAYLTQSK
ncbi:glycoside hydrolase family 15 protein [Tardisphaera miroshnichenkoae]